MHGHTTKRTRSTMVLGSQGILPLSSPRFIFRRHLLSLTPTTITCQHQSQQYCPLVLSACVCVCAYLQSGKYLPDVLDAGSQPCSEDATLLWLIKEGLVQRWSQPDRCPDDGSDQGSVEEAVE